jgi:hypothetical protein
MDLPEVFRLASSATLPAAIAACVYLTVRTLLIPLTVRTLLIPGRSRSGRTVPSRYSRSCAGSAVEVMVAQAPSGANVICVSDEPIDLQGVDAVGMTEDGRLMLYQMKYDRVRSAVQELHDVSRDDFHRQWSAWSGWLASDPVVRRRALLVRRDEAEALAHEAEKSRMPNLAKLVRAGAKFGIVTIIAAIISGPVNQAEADIMGWTPPSITQIRQMSPAQMDELSRQIEHQLDQWELSQEHGGQESGHGGQQPPVSPGQGSPANIPRP